MKRQAFQPTPEQRNVIRHSGSAFVTACPGAGKTRVIAARALRLFGNMPAGRGVAFLSFTKGAIFELETRLREARILSSPVFPSFIGTFDSFVWQFLVAPFGITDCDVRPRLIADVADLAVKPFNGGHELPLSCFCPLTGTIFAKAAKQRGFDVSQKSPGQIQAYVTAASRIRARLRAHGQLGFDEARSVALQRLKDTEAAGRIAAALAGRFREVIVDEAQDCNPDDLHILSWLRDSCLPVKVLCDPAQSIYQFRGGVTDDLLAFSETFGDEERRALTGNFRSAPNICKAAAQLRPMGLSIAPDESLGRYKNDSTPVLVLSYRGTAVRPVIGQVFYHRVAQAEIDLSQAPIVAATKASGAAASGQPRPGKSRHRAVRLAEAVTNFHFAAGFNDIKTAIDQVHHILLELEGRLGDLSYRQYLADHEIETASWRPRVLFLLRELRFDSSKYSDAKAWHAAAKELLSQHLVLEVGQSLSQKLKWNDAVSAALTAVPVATAMPRTIHAVKGMEFPAVCVVTTSSTLKRILDYLETGDPADRAEDARKLYVAASRAEKLLVIAAPQSQAGRLANYLRGRGAAVEINGI